MNNLSNISVVIRSSGERTNERAKELLLAQGLQDYQIVIIQEIPFSKAVIRTFEEGIKANKKWTLGLDADVLYRNKGLENQIAFAETLPDSYFMIQGMILDKIRLIKRNGGGHLYRTSLLSMALENFKPISDLDRPEGTLNLKMKELGHPYFNWDKLLALHDYEQYYIDLFRKGYAQAIKHYSTSKKLSRLWAQLMVKDLDYLMIYLGFIAGMNYGQKMGIEELSSIGKKTLLSLGIKEKEKLTSEINIESVIDEFVLYPQLYKHQQSIISTSDTLKLKRRNLPGFQISRILRKLGWRPENLSGIFE